MSPQRLQYNYYVQVLMPFYAGKLLLLRDLNCAHAMFLVSNNSGNSYNVLAMHEVSKSLAFKLRCLKR